MIRFKPLPEDIEQRLPLAAAYLRSHPGVFFAYLFGGLARGERRPLSDVDIAVYLAGSVTADVKLDIMGKLIDILGTDEIDLVILNTAPPLLAMNVLRKKQVMADNNPAMRHRFESLAFKKYFDFLPVELGMLTKRVANG
ncbi:MAG: nucleotidyltransferase domain-containing protein [Deltaproteobacteria bacterium]|nr:MAG: nucleotidyltransferase domain-containing protein [Deltaproteobacteria bacterium]